MRSYSTDLFSRVALIFISEVGCKKRGAGPLAPSQNGHFASDALSSDLNPRSSTHNQMKAELELFPSVSIVSGDFGRGQKLWHRAFSYI